MSYTKHNFVTGTTIQAAPFNEMDNQIAANEQAIAGKLAKPNWNGAAGQLLKSNGDGTTDWVNAPSGSGSATIDPTLKKQGWAADAKATGDAIDALTTAIADIQYKAISISNFSVSPNSVEIGNTITSVTLSYSLNKKPTTSQLDGSAAGIVAKSGSIEQTGLSLTANKTWTLVVTDERGTTATKMVTLKFYYKVYYGVAVEPEAINSTFINGLTSYLASSKDGTITVNANNGKYIWYAVPSTFGACSFSVGGFVGGFTKVATFTHTNSSGGQASYDVYRSDNPDLGNTTVTVS